MTVTSEKGTKFTVKTELAASLSKPFKEREVEKVEEASKREYELVGTDMETEYEGIDTVEEEKQIAELNEEETELFHQYKEFSTIQGRTKRKMLGFQYIHRLKVKDWYPGIPSDVAEMLSLPVKGEVQDIDQIIQEEIIEIERRHASVPRRKVNIHPGKRSVILCLDLDSDSDVIIEEEDEDFKSRCFIVKGEKMRNPRQLSKVKRVLPRPLNKRWRTWMR